MKPFRSLLIVLLGSIAPGCLLIGCAGLVKDNANVLYISVPDQALELQRHGEPIARYPVSTSKYGLGDERGSNRTPLGRMEVARKIGAGKPAGTVFKDRRPTGEILAANAPGRDPIVTRILWLRGEEARNRNAFRRYIYIHGTPEERNIGSPASYGCIRMRSNDIIALYDAIGTGAQVVVLNQPLDSIAPDDSAMAE
jgi:lipoprotein-anchoring transpeptidase ErfK/SrfK